MLFVSDVVEESVIIEEEGGVAAGVEVEVEVTAEVAATAEVEAEAEAEARVEVGAGVGAEVQNVCSLCSSSTHLFTAEKPGRVLGVFGLSSDTSGKLMKKFSFVASLRSIKGVK